jgi:hypothetical protein
MPDLLQEIISSRLIPDDAFRFDSFPKKVSIRSRKGVLSRFVQSWGGVEERIDETDQGSAIPEKRRDSWPNFR